MSRQHATPLLIGPGGAAALQHLPMTAGDGQVSEAQLQQLLHDHPACLPINEIDPLFAGPVPICMELSTPAGPIDNFMITPSGLPVLVECKLWRNPEGRREVVGQILDYAKELTRWSASDIQREVARRLGGEGNPVLRLLAAAGHAVDEIAFNDALTHNLRRGRFLLLIVGDGIREGVEAIAEYLQVHAGLHFSLGLVELPIYVAPNGQRLVVPRVLARTELITRTVIEVPEGLTIDDETQPSPASASSDVLSEERYAFWRAFVEHLSFDDPDQILPKATRQGSIYAAIPGGVTAGPWLTIYRKYNQNALGVYLSYSRPSLGERLAMTLVEQDGEEIVRELGGGAHIMTEGEGRRLILDERSFADLRSEPGRAEGITWLRGRVNDFVNVLRPRLKTLVANMEAS